MHSVATIMNYIINVCSEEALQAQAMTLPLGLDHEQNLSFTQFDKTFVAHLCIFIFIFLQFPSWPLASCPRKAVADVSVFFHSYLHSKVCYHLLLFPLDLLDVWLLVH